MTKCFKEWHWEITRICNLRCCHCITDCGVAGKNELSTQDALLAVRQMVKLGGKRIMVTGGEPLARKDTITILNACKSKGLSLRLITNGFTANRHLVSELSSLLDLIGISLDGATKATHDAVRGDGSFDKACRAISFFSFALPVSVYITVSGQNIHEVEAIIKKAFELGACNVHVSEVSIFGRAVKNEVNLALTQEQKKRLKKIAERMAKRHGDLCELNLSTVYLGCDGLVYPCSEVAVMKPSKFIGNILSASCVKDLVSLSTRWVSPMKKCCYVVYQGPKIVFCLGSDYPCYMIGGTKP